MAQVRKEEWGGGHIYLCMSVSIGLQDSQYSGQERVRRIDPLLFIGHILEAGRVGISLSFDRQIALMLCSEFH